MTNTENCFRCLTWMSRHLSVAFEVQEAILGAFTSHVSPVVTRSGTGVCSLPDIVLEVFHNQQLMVRVQEGPSTEAPSVRADPRQQRASPSNDMVCIPCQQRAAGHIAGKHLARQPQNAVCTQNNTLVNKTASSHTWNMPPQEVKQNRSQHNICVSVHSRPCTGLCCLLQSHKPSGMLSFLNPKAHSFTLPLCLAFYPEPAKLPYCAADANADLACTVQ